MAFLLPLNSVNAMITGETFFPGGVLKSGESGALMQSTALSEVNGNVGIGTSSPTVSLEIRRTDSVLMPAGTTLQRPANQAGQIRFNTSTSSFEGNNGNTWASIGSVPQNLVSISNSYVMTSAEDLIVNTSEAGVTVTLPDAAAIKSYYFQNSGNGAVSIQTINNQTINGEPLLIMQFRNSSLRLVSTGTAFLIF